jgi:lysophospholipase L1-like esterase
LNKLIKKNSLFFTRLVCAAILWLVGVFLHVSMMKQLGILAVSVILLFIPVLFVEEKVQAKIKKRIKRYCVHLTVFMAIFFCTGELALRLWFFHGASFGHHFGPIVERFEENFDFNRYSGKSRGPEIKDPTRHKSLRILVQGDSITWGQGVRSEHDLYTTRLLSELRKDNPDCEMAVMAKPGRELNGHLLELAKWGEKLRPDIIIYQFYINDLELSHTKRPRSKRIWRRAFFNRPLVQASYFWFFLDYSLDSLLTTDNKDNYYDYMRACFSTNTDEWIQAISVFRTWAREAKRLTPKVLIVLYPSMNPQGGLALEPIYERFTKEAQALGIQVVNLWDAFSDLQDDLKRIKASAYDAHPSAEVHGRMAQSIYDELSKLSVVSNDGGS